jgi:hypothetical protein
VECGARPRKPKLPKPSRKISSRTNLYPVEHPDDTPGAPGKPSVARQRLFEADPANAISVPPFLESPHPLVEKTVLSLSRSRPDKITGLAKPAQKKTLDVAVSPATTDRAMRIFDTLIKAMDSRGMRLTIEEGKTYVHVNGEKIAVGLKETLKKVPHKPTEKETRDFQRYHLRYRKYDSASSGRLVLYMDTFRFWAPDPLHERKNMPLEGRLNRFMLSLVEMSEKIKDDRIEEARREREQEIRRKKRAEEYKRHKIEKANVERLEEMDRLHRTAEGYRKLALAVKQQATKRTDRADALEWAEWALTYADRIDPARAPELPRLK